MAGVQLDRLDDDALLNLGARLENQLSAANDTMKETVAERDKIAAALTKPGLKLGTNTILLALGVAFAPLTLSWSLIVTAGGFGMAVWDMFDYAIEVRKFLRTKRRVSSLRRQAFEITTALMAIDHELTRRPRRPADAVPPS